MKIFATSDIHGNKIIARNLKEFLENSDVDELIICGDIGGKNWGGTLIEFGKKQKQDLDDILNILQSDKYRTQFILSNDDWMEADSYDLRYLPNCHYTKQFLVPFELVHITPFTTNREANENKIAYELSKLQIDNQSIVVAHDPPYKCLDKCSDGREVGSKSIRKLIEEKQPKIWLCGHIHEAAGVDKIGNTMVFNCACRHERNELRGWIIDTETLDFERIII